MSETTKKLARKMIWLRITQMLINEEYKAGKFKIPIHLALGHEAIATAIDAVMSPHDKLVLSHRNIAYNLVRSNSFQKVLDEYLLKESGLAKGKLGSMNLAAPHHGIVYSSSILGNNFPVATGLALAQRVRKEKGATFVLGGDGSMEEGSFYESLINTKSLKLPIIFIIENNGWSLATHINERREELNLRNFAKAIGVTYLRLSGNNVVSYTQKLNKVRKSAVYGKPAVVEVIVDTLGDWIKKDGKRKHFVNYHSGPAPTVSTSKGSIIIKNSNTDPLWVIKSLIGEKNLKETAGKIWKEIMSEIK